MPTLCHNLCVRDGIKTSHGGTQTITCNMMTEEKMIDRRKFIKDAAGALAGIAFTGCSLLNAAQAAQPAAKRRQIVIKGRRVKTIDVHSHCVIPEAMALMGLKLTDAVKGQREQVIVVQDRLLPLSLHGVRKLQP